MDERQGIIRTQMEEAEATKIKLRRQRPTTARTDGGEPARSPRGSATRREPTRPGDPRGDAREGPRGVRPDHRGAAASSWRRSARAIVRQLRAEIGTLAVDLAEPDRRRVARGRGPPAGTVDRFLDELGASAAAARGGPLMEAASRQPTPPRSERLDALARRERRVPLAGVGRRAARRGPRCCGASRGCAGRWPTRPRTGADRAGLLAACSTTRSPTTPPDCCGCWRPAAGRAAAICSTPSRRLGVEALLASADAPASSPTSRTSCSGSARSSTATAARGGARATRRPPAEPARPLVDALLERQGASRPRSGWSMWRCTASAGAASRASLTRLVELAADRRDRQVAYVTAAVPLSEEQEQRSGRSAAPSSTAGRSTSRSRSTRTSLGGMQRPGRRRPLRRHRLCAGWPRRDADWPAATDDPHSADPARR